MGGSGEKRRELHVLTSIWLQCGQPQTLATLQRQMLSTVCIHIEMQYVECMHGYMCASQDLELESNAWVFSGSRDTKQCTSLICTIEPSNYIHRHGVKVVRRTSRNERLYK